MLILQNYERLPPLPLAPVNHMHIEVNHNQVSPKAQMSSSHETMFTQCVSRSIAGQML